MTPVSPASARSGRRYRSPIDTRARVLTVGVITTFVLASLLFGFMSTPHQLVSGLFLAFGGAAVGIAHTFRPTGFAMGPDCLVIYFPWRQLRIPWSSVSEVYLEPRNKSFRVVRVLGSGGIFGDIGRYWSPALGMHLRMVTDRSRIVVLRRRVPYCLSPDDPDRFVREAQSYLRTSG